MLSHYYLHLALRSLRRNKILTALMVVAIALGVGASMTTLTMLYILSGDPIPTKSGQLYYVQLDPQDMDDYIPGGEPEEQVTRFDAEALLAAKRADRQAMMAGGGVAIEPGRAELRPFSVDARYASADFFPMFEVPFRHGGGWSGGEDTARARVAVISKELNDKLFAGENSVGRPVRIEGSEFRVVGVLDRWRPTPYFFDINNGVYREVEQVFVPFSTARDLKLARQGNMNCWGDEVVSDLEAVNAPCTWIQFWVELGTAEKASAYHDYLMAYSGEQHRAGRFQRPPNVRLRGLMAWLDHKRVVPGDVRIMNWLAFGFLAVCLLNTVGLLLAKFLRRSSEIGVRRALGASRRAIFAQFLIEAATVGTVGGGLGLGLAWLGLWGVRNLPEDYARLAELDLVMLATTFAVAIAASALAGLLPAWRACQVTPALQLKSQ